MFLNRMNSETRKINSFNKPHKGNKNVLLSDSTNLIEVRNISKTFVNSNLLTTVLKDVSVDIKKNEFVVILGPSGSGKTTLMNIISGLDRATTGSVNVLNNELINMNDEELTHFRRENIGYIFQQYGLLPNLRVKENIEIGLHLYNLNEKQKKKSNKKNKTEKSLEIIADNSELISNDLQNTYDVYYRDGSHFEDNVTQNSNANKEDKISIEYLLETLNLKAIENKFPSQLSGGQQQRVSIARALSKNPKILFADEPTGAIDTEMSKTILDIFQKVNRDFKTTIIIVTHNPLIAELATKVIYFKNGSIDKIVENNRPKNVNDVKW